MGTDVLGLGMALAAVHLASRPASSQRTWGTYRLEVLAALANGVLLFGVAGYILFEAWRRFSDPPEVAGVAVVVVAAIGLAVNLISFRLLRAGSAESLNVKGAYLEVLSDMLGSVGVIVAGAVVALTDWPYADPIIAASIGLFILPRTWRLCAQAVRIIMEIAPPEVDVAEVERRFTDSARRRRGARPSPVDPDLRYRSRFLPCRNRRRWRCPRRPRPGGRAPDRRIRSGSFDHPVRDLRPYRRRHQDRLTWRWTRPVPIIQVRHRTMATTIRRHREPRVSANRVAPTVARSAAGGRYGSGWRSA